MTIGDASVPVVILRLDHHGALGITRSLGRLGVAVYGVHSNQRAPAFASRYCRGGFDQDLDHRPVEESLDFLCGLARRLGGRAILLPSNDETALFTAAHASTLREFFLFPHNSEPLVRSLLDKLWMSSLAKQSGLPTAEAVCPQSRQDVLTFCSTAQFPVVLKASDGISVARRSGTKMVIARNEKELINSYDAMADPLQHDLMLQEYIPGADDSVWMFNGYFDENSDCLFGMTGRKIHQNPVYCGMTALGICLKNDQVEHLTRQFMKKIGYRGILDIGFRYDARDNRYKVLDVNPRVGATFRLFVGDNGLDVVRAMYLHMTGQPVPRWNMCEGRKWLVEDLDVLSCIQYIRDGVLTFPKWLASLRHITESAWFARDDIRPFLNMCFGLAARPFQKVSRRVHGKLRPPLAMRASAGGLQRGA